MPSRVRKMGSAMNVMGGVAFGGLDYTMRRSDGESHGEALAKAGGIAALYTFFPQAGIALTMYDLFSASQGLIESAMEKKQGGHSSLYQANFGAGFTDTANRATMRQRAMQHVQNSRQGLGSILGKEARPLNNRSYY